MDTRKLNPWNWFSADDNKHEFWNETKENYRQTLEYMQRELDIMKNGLSNASDYFPASLWNRTGKTANVLSPKTDIIENDNHYSILLEVPGVKEKDISLEIKDNTLKVSGVKVRENEKEETDFHRMECFYGKFIRAISLPDDVDTDRVKAKSENGVVKINLPRKEIPDSNSKKIKLE